MSAPLQSQLKRTPAVPWCVGHPGAPLGAANVPVSGGHPRRRLATDDIKAWTQAGMCAVLRESRDVWLPPAPRLSHASLQPVLLAGWSKATAMLHIRLPNIA